jgi:hypothetical protein
MKAYVRAKDAGVFLFSSVHSWCQDNRRSLSVWLFALVIATLAMFPPWLTRIEGYSEHDRYGSGDDSYSNYSEKPPIETALWHAPLWQRPNKRGYLWAVRVDYSRLFLEASVAESLVAALYLTWGRKGR